MNLEYARLETHRTELRAYLLTRLVFALSWVREHVQLTHEGTHEGKEKREGGKKLRKTRKNTPLLSCVNTYYLLLFFSVEALL